MLRNHPLRRALVAALAAIASVALVPSVASAAPTWLPSQDISTAGYTGSAMAVASSPDGNSAALFYKYENPCCSPEHLDVATRTPGGSWVRKQLSSPGDTAYYGDVAMDAHDNTIAVWAETIGTGNVVIRAAIKPAGQNWRAADDLSGGGQYAYSPQIAMSPSGQAVVVWYRNNGANYVVQARTLSPGSTTWSDLMDNVSAPGQNASSPDVAVDNDGKAVAVWYRYNGANYIVQAATWKPGDTSFTALADLSATGQNATSPRVAMTPDGRATAVWYRYNGAHYVVQSAARGTSGNFATAIDVSDPNNYDSYSPQVAVDGSNRAVATWYSRNVSDGTYAVQAATRPSNSFFTTPDKISTPGNTSYSPMVALAPDGTAIVTFQGYTTTDFKQAVQYNKLPPGASNWVGVQDLEVAQGSGVGSTTPYGPVPIATDNQGNAVAIWNRSTQTASGADYTVRAAGYDAAGPTITGLNIPSSGNTGSPLSMGVAATDRWSGPMTFNWAFGDGTGAGGSGVSHAYGSPGTYNVAVTARDGAGNTSSAGRTVQISTPGGGCVDNDHDGFCAGQDCNDNNPKINPSAHEIPGNNIDENCDGIAAPLPDVNSSVLMGWTVQGSSFKVSTFGLKGLKRGWKVWVLCKGTGCPAKSQRIISKKTKKGNLNALKLLKKRNFKAGQTVTVKFTAPGYNAKFAIFKLKKGKIPNGVARCQTNGTTKLRACR